MMDLQYTLTMLKITITFLFPLIFTFMEVGMGIKMVLMKMTKLINGLLNLNLIWNYL